MRPLLAAALLLLLCACQPAPQLESTSWRWVTIHHADTTDEPVEDRGNYTLRFLPAPDRIAIAEADCNTIASTYTIDGASLTLNPGAASLTFCGPQSLFTRYLGLLSHVSRYELTGATLQLTVADDGTTMVFAADRT